MSVEANLPLLTRMAPGIDSGGEPAGEPGLDAALDRKTHALVLLAVTAALRLEARLAPCIAAAKAAGASRCEVVAAMLAGVPAAGPEVLSLIPRALLVFDEPYLRGQE